MSGTLHEIFKRKIVSVGFARRIDLLGATTLGVGALMGAGIYVLIGLAAHHAGPGVWLAYLACGLLVLPSVVVFAEFSRRIPVSGGGYVFAYHAMGSLGGFITGWVLALGSILACSMYAIGFAYYLGSFLRPDLPEFALRLIAIALIGFLASINCRGTAGGDKLQQIFTLGNLLILLVLLSLSLTEISPGRMRPLLPNGLSGISVAISIIYISFFGYQLIANNAEETIDPEKTVPRAMLLSFLISLGFYLAVALIAVLVVPWEQLAASRAPLVDVAARGIGPLGWVLIGFGGILASAAALNGTLLSQGRQIYAMGKDRFLPTLLGRVHELRQTPQPALLAGSLATVLAVAVGDLESIAKIANFCFLVSMILSSVALEQLYRQNPPEGRWRAVRRLAPALSLLCNVALLLTLDWVSMTLGIQIVFLGLIIYFAYSKRRGIRAKVGISLILQEKPARTLRRGPSILVPMANPRTQSAIISTARALLRSRGGEIVLLSVITAPEQRELSSALSEAEHSLDILERSTQLLQSSEVEFRPIVRVSRSLPKGIVHAAAEEGCRMIIMGYSAEGSAGEASLMESMLNTAPMDIVFLKLKSDFPPKRIAVALGGRTNLPLMVGLAGALAESYSGRIFFLHILPQDYTREQRLETDRLLLEAIRTHASNALYQIEVLTSDNPLGLMVEKSAEYDLLIVGTTRISLLEHATVGSFTTQLVERSQCSVAIARVISTTRKAVSTFSETFN